MAGIVNDVLYAINADFSSGNSATVSESNGLATNGQIWIGRTAVNAGGTHVDVGTITAGSGVTVTNGPGAITIGLIGGGSAIMSVSGTANRITSTGGTTPVIDISSAYVGQTSITTLGTVATGVWSGTAIGTTKGGTGLTAAGTSGNVLTSDGTNWASSAPVCGSIGVQSFVSANQPNVTGDGTGYTVIFDNNTWQLGGSNMNNGTGVFTVPAGGAGKYLVSYGLTFTGLTAAHVDAQFNIETNLGTATKKLFNPGVSRTTGGNFNFNDTTIVNLAVAQTIYVSGSVSGGAKVVGFQGEFFGLFGYIEIFKLAN